MTHLSPSRPGPGRSRTWTLAPLVAVALLAAVPTAAHAALDTRVALDQSVTGAAPWDSDAPGAGRDGSADDDVVRTNDTVTYRWSVNVNETTGAQGTFDRVRFVQTLPEGLSWSASDVPAYCKGTGWSLTGQTLTCVYAPPGGKGQTGSTLNFTLTARADADVPDGFVAKPAADAVSVTAISGKDESPAATTQPKPVTITSAPFVDVVKNTPSARRVDATANRPAGYVLTYSIQLRVPQSRTSTHGVRGTALPETPITVVDDFSAVSPNAEYLGCTGAGFTCDVTGSTAKLTFSQLDAGAPASNGNLVSRSISIFVPASDVSAAGTSGTIKTTNSVRDLVAGARDVDGHLVPSTGDDLANNVRDYQLITVGGSGTTSFNKTLASSTGGLLASQSRSNDGNGQVLPGQVVLSKLSVRNDSTVATTDGVAVCDVWDPSGLSLSTEGPGPKGHAGAPVWGTGTYASWTAGKDYVVEYGTQAAPTGDDAARWTAERSRTACGDDVDTWTTTAPADLGTVTKVRIRLLRALPENANGEFRVNLQVSRTAGSGAVLANFLGTKVDTGSWTASTYQPSTHDNFGRGDRVRVNGVTIAVEKTALEPAAAGLGQAVTIVSGEGVRFAVTPKITTLNDDATTATATNVVVRDRLPLGMSYDSSRPTTPSAYAPVLSTDADGRQILTWTIPSVKQGEEPQLTYWTTTASTKAGALVNDAIVTSTEDQGGLDTFPASTTSTGDKHLARQTVVMQSPGGVQISKSTDQLFVEPNDELAYRVTYANLTADAVRGIDVIDVLPFVGDGTTAGGTVGRSPETAFAGTAPLAGVDVKNGETVRYTDAAPADVFAATDPRSTTGYGPLPAGHAWCLESQLGTTDCPEDLKAVTAIRLTRTDALASGTDVSVKVRLQPQGDRSGDLFSNTAAIRYTGGSLGAVSNIATIRVVASSIGDYVWLDANENGRQDDGELPLANVPVTLEGTDKHGRAISLKTVTDEHGRYLFTSSSQDGQDAGVLDLVSGRYVVTFHKDGLPTGTRFTVQHADGVSTAEDSDADPTTGRSQVLVLPDPSPTGKDGQDLTLDAGVILGAGDPPVEPQQPETPTTPETPTAPAPPTIPAPPAPAPPPVVLSDSTRFAPAKLSLTKSASARTVRAGRTVTYRLTVRNTGRSTARELRVCDVLPAHVSVVSRGGGSLRGGRICWTAKRLRAGGSLTRTLTLRVDGDAQVRRLVNHGVATAKGVRSARAARTVRVRPAPPRRLNESYVTG